MSETKESLSDAGNLQSPRHSLERLSNQIICNALGEVANRRNSVNYSSCENTQLSLNNNVPSNVVLIDQVITAK